MTKRVKLPNALGGAEVDAIVADPLPMMIAGQPVAACHVPDVGWVAVPTSKLTDVPPPLPPEPEPGMYEVRRPGSSGQWLIQRCAAHPDAWRMAGHEGWLSWPEVLQIIPGATVTRLVPAPEPVTLPWSLGKRDRYEAQVWPAADSRGPTGNVCDRNTRYGAGVGSETTVNLTPAEARAKAYALLSAADQAEAVDRG